MNYYQEAIREDLARMGQIGVNPRHVEAWMRSERGTLDSLSKGQFRQEVKEAVACIKSGGDKMSEELARSFGL